MLRALFLQLILGVRALDLNQLARLGDSIGGPTEPLVDRVLDQSNLVNHLIVLFGVNVAGDILVLLAPLGPFVPLEGVQVGINLVHNQHLRRLEKVIPNRRCAITCSEHSVSESVPVV